jgi:hypothetical protein
MFFWGWLRLARHEHLPIHKAALDMTVHFEKLVAGFSRYHKYTLGTELLEGSYGALSVASYPSSTPQAAVYEHTTEQRHSHDQGVAGAPLQLRHPLKVHAA